MNTKPNILIFSVFQSKLSYDQNMMNHNGVTDYLTKKEIYFKILTGVYENNSEMSILVDFNQRSLVEELVKTFNQECYLESHNDRASFLIFNDKDKRFIGTLTNVSQSEAIASNNYSYDFENNQYFITKD